MSENNEKKLGKTNSVSTRNGRSSQDLGFLRLEKESDSNDHKKDSEEGTSSAVSAACQTPGDKSIGSLTMSVEDEPVLTVADRKRLFEQRMSTMQSQGLNLLSGPETLMSTITAKGVTVESSAACVLNTLVPTLKKCRIQEYPKGARGTVTQFDETNPPISSLPPSKRKSFFGSVWKYGPDTNAVQEQIKRRQSMPMPKLGTMSLSSCSSSTFNMSLPPLPISSPPKNDVTRTYPEKDYIGPLCQPGIDDLVYVPSPTLVKTPSTASVSRVRNVWEQRAIQNDWRSSVSKLEKKIECGSAPDEKSFDSKVVEVGTEDSDFTDNDDETIRSNRADGSKVWDSSARAGSIRKSNSFTHQFDEFFYSGRENEEFTIDTILEEPKPLSSSSPCVKDASGSPVMGPMVRTVSAFRLQQSKSKSTIPPFAPIKYEVSANVSSTLKIQIQERIAEKVSTLENEAISQDQNIAQLSKALEMCRFKPNFAASDENVERERLLLIATLKKKAISNELRQLTILGKKNNSASPAYPSGKFDDILGVNQTGKITLDNFRIMIKREFVSKTIKAKTNSHFIVALSYKDRVYETPVVSIGYLGNDRNFVDNMIHFERPISITNLDVDFSIKLEVYMLRTRKESVLSDASVKPPWIVGTMKKVVSIGSGNKFTKTLSFTQDKSSGSPKLVKHSQAPSQLTSCDPSDVVIKTPNFVHVGELCITFKSLQRALWNFDDRFESGPLEGCMLMTTSCGAMGGLELKGFLSIFDEVSGIAWNRMWCKLTLNHLTYWKYPEDEANGKECIGEIVLGQCVTSSVGPVNPDVCARANTFVFVTTRDPEEGDKSTIVVSLHEKYTAIRHLFSADTRADCETWCHHLNRHLLTLRTWDPKARTPNDELF